MEKLAKEQAEALNRMLAEMTTEQCFITMRSAMNAFISKVCEEITPHAAVQYGKLVYPLTHDMARLEAFHDAMKKEARKDAE